jgi:hypothetical protein
VADIKEKPILFSAPMVRAKTQTRRIVKPQPPEGSDVPVVGSYGVDWDYFGARTPASRNPYGSPGDRLWVRETWGPRIEDGKPHEVQRYVKYRAAFADDSPPDDGMDWHTYESRWRSPIFMPRWASRLTLELTEVRAQRIQQTSHEDALAEGIMATKWATAPLDLREQRLTLAQLAYSHLWDEINGKGSWASNPWVWAITFRRVEEPEESASGKL